MVRRKKYLLTKFFLNKNVLCCVIVNRPFVLTSYLWTTKQIVEVYSTSLLKEENSSRDFILSYSDGLLDIYKFSFSVLLQPSNYWNLKYRFVNRQLFGMSHCKWNQSNGSESQTVGSVLLEQSVGLKHLQSLRFDVKDLRILRLFTVGTIK